MRKFLVLTLIAFMSISADHVKKIVTFDVYNFKKTSTSCHITGHANFVNFEKKTVKREYSITTTPALCPFEKSKHTCHLWEVTREVDDAKLSRVEGTGACRPTISPDAGLLKAFCEQVPESKDCSK